MLGDEELFKVRELVTRLVRSNKKPWEKLQEIAAFLETIAGATQ